MDSTPAYPLRPKLVLGLVCLVRCNAWQQMCSNASLMFHDAIVDTTAVISSMRFCRCSWFFLCLLLMASISSSSSCCRCWSPETSRGSSLSGLNVRMSGTTASNEEEDMEAFRMGWMEGSWVSWESSWLRMDALVYRSCTRRRMLNVNTCAKLVLVWRANCNVRHCTTLHTTHRAYHCRWP